MPEPIRAEVAKREREMTIAMQENSEARNFMQAAQGLSQKYSAALSAEGVDLGTATANLMELSSRLRFGTPQEKADIVTKIIRNYGVDIDTLDKTLVAPVQPGGLPPQGGMPPPQQPMMTDPRVDQLFAALQTQRENNQNMTVQNVENFIAAQEFGNDVRHDMADIMDSAARRGIEMTLEQAYDRACKIHPEISEIFAQREAAGRNAGGASTVDAAAAAASSVRNQPAEKPTQTGGDGSIRGAILDAIDTAQ